MGYCPDIESADCERDNLGDIVKHKHCELIKKWADGATIQFLASDGEWVTACKGSVIGWFDTYEYRVKPEPKPDFVKGLYVGPAVTISPASNPNLRLTFDGETRELKSAEVILRT